MFKPINAGQMNLSSINLNHISTYWYALLEASCETSMSDSTAQQEYSTKEFSTSTKLGQASYKTWTIFSSKSTFGIKPRIVIMPEIYKTSSQY